MPGPDERSADAALIANALGCDETQALDAVRILTAKGLTPLASVVIHAPQGKGRWLKLTCSDNDYYAFFDSVNFLETIRKDSTAGELVFQVYY